MQPRPRMPVSASPCACMGALPKHSPSKKKNKKRQLTVKTWGDNETYYPKSRKLSGYSALHGKNRVCSIPSCPQSPHVISPECQCGWKRQDPKHVIIFCPHLASNRRRLYEEAETLRYQEMLSTRKGLRAVERSVMREGLLGRFSPVRKQMDQAEWKVTEDGDIKETIE